MVRMVILTFAFLGWAWYEMSGGSDFVAGDNGVTLLARVEQGPVERGTPTADQPVTVARADTSAAPLTDLTTAVALETEPRKLASLAGPVILSDAVAAPAPAVALAEPSAEPVEPDLRAVTGNRVNLRFGPGTNFAVVTQLLRGDEVEVLADEGAGWVKLRVLDSNRVGWMSGNFLAASN